MVAKSRLPRLSVDRRPSTRSLISTSWRRAQTMARKPPLRRIGTLPLQYGLMLLLLSAAAMTGARGDEVPKVKFEFHGYATLGLVHSDEDQADFRGSLLID